MSPFCNLGKVNKEADKIMKKIAKFICNKKTTVLEREHYLHQIKQMVRGLE